MKCSHLLMLSMMMQSLCVFGTEGASAPLVSTSDRSSAADPSLQMYSRRRKAATCLVVAGVIAAVTAIAVTSRSPIPVPICDLPSWRGGIPNPDCYQIDIYNGKRTHNFRPFCFRPNVTDIASNCPSGLAFNVSKIQDEPWMVSCPYPSCFEANKVKDIFPKVCTSCFPENKPQSSSSKFVATKNNYKSARARMAKFRAEHRKQ